MAENHKLKLLPPKIDYTILIKEISEANRILGSLNGLLANIPNQSLLISPLLTKEAVASSKIEGTQATIEEVFKYEAEGKSSEKDSKEQDIREIINYRTAIHIAIELLKEKPIGENFIKKLHSILLDSVRGTNKDKGNFRKTPVFIGKPGATIENAIFIPPSASELNNLISNWGKFVNSIDEPDVLVQTAISHYQFEAIHPFLDGNGRIGRLLIPIMLYEKGILSYPLLYVSEYFERNRDNYYAYLRMVDKDDDWESWIKYFLESIKDQALDTQNKVLNMLELYKSVKEKLSDFNSQYAIHLLDIIFENPVTSFKNIKTKINTNSYQTIYNLLDKFQEEKILVEITGGKRNKIFVFDELMKIIR
ncbi:Fic family protein [Hyunsoonleella ulvae]|uniref:Fic family protein n=1 Tax=Hyunsoonleella ulvae TaxID=2799948 RepID=UPI001939B767|nr:Fic family protein [Hyunsoonleella ulvae]